MRLVIGWSGSGCHCEDRRTHENYLGNNGAFVLEMNVMLRSLNRCK